MSLFCRKFLKNWVPPALLRRLSYFHGKRNRFIGNFKSWQEATGLCSGYDAEFILDKVLDATLKVKRGESAFERDSVNFDVIQYSWPVIAAMMCAAARNKGNLHVLDYGGSLGTSYFQNRKFLSGLKALSWHVVEQAHYVEAGKKFIQDDALKFYPNVDDSIKSITPNLILLSSVAQYLPELGRLLDMINNIDASFLVFDRTPFTDEDDDKICVQLVPGKIYKASYPLWLLSRNKLMSHLTNWKVFESFPNDEGKLVSESGIEFEFSGYIFERAYV